MQKNQPKLRNLANDSDEARQSTVSLLLKLDYCIYIYICNELIEETANHRKLIFGMWESFGYGSSKF